MAQKITALKVQKKNTARINIYLDDEFAFGLSRVTATWLSIGQELSQDDITKLKAEDEIEVAYQRALNYLSYRVRTVAEVQEKLSSLEYTKEVIKVVTTRLMEKGYLDDRQFAETWVENRSTFRPRSHRLLNWELRNKKVNQTIIDEIITNSEPDEALARAAAEKYIRRLRDLDRQAFFRRLGGFLGRRGFTYDVISTVVKECWAQVENKNLKMEMDE
jgi:regulatory protein